MNLRVDNLSFGYYQSHPVLHDINLEIKPGQVTGLFGPNGSGKSTLLHCLNGALRPRSGRILIGDSPLDSLTLHEIARRIAVVPQETISNTPFTVYEIVMQGRFSHWNIWGQISDEDINAVHKSLERVSASHLIHHHFDELSGGERQRVIIARALAQDTRILLMDEPANHLDISHQVEIYGLIRKLASENYTVLMVCHDLMIAPMFVDFAILMKEGKIYSTGQTNRVLNADNLAAVFDLKISLHWPNHGTVTAMVNDFDCMNCSKEQFNRDKK
jgi:iron complex transport system ATP-binding protein